MSVSRRPGVGFTTLLLLFVSLTILATRCLPHPVGAARTFGKYEEKARSTADAALSEVATVDLAAHNAHRSFGPFLSTVISDAEEALSGLQGTFDSIQPPDERADAVQEDLDGVLSDALEHVRSVRTAVRRGELDALDHEAEPLADDADRLQSFSIEHA